MTNPRQGVPSSNPSMFSALGPNGRVVFGAGVVALVSYLGIVVPTVSGLYLIWPIAPLWAAFGWGSSRGTVLGILLLAVMGFGHDLLTDAIYGTWGVIYLSAYMIGAIFRPSRAGDSPMIQHASWAFALFLGYLLFLWFSQAYGGAGLWDGRMVIGLLVTGISYQLGPIKSFFRIRDDKQVAA